MKKYITVAALLAAGTAFANAGVETITFESAADESNGGKYCGFVFTLSGTDTTRFTDDYAIGLPQTLSLDEIIVNERSGYDWNANATLYITDSDNGFVGIADTAERTTDTWTFSFSNLTLTTTETYYVYIWHTDDTAISSSTAVGTVISGGKFYSEGGVSAFGGSLDTSTASQWGLLNAQKTLASTSYAPAGLKIVTSIPEPSAFGMLAGLGALALVASRRRRK